MGRSPGFRWLISWFQNYNFKAPTAVGDIMQGYKAFVDFAVFQTSAFLLAYNESGNLKTEVNNVFLQNKH